MKNKFNIQKLFCFASLIFILVCIFWYGGRLIYFYQDSKKTITEEATTFARIVKTENHDKETFKQIQQDYYFYGDATNNYVSYSNMIWRIVKVNKDNSIVLVTDSIVGTLAYGNGEVEYQDSVLLNWLNLNNDDDTSGVFEKILNEKEKYLVKNTTCVDTVDSIENVTCDEVYNDGYLGLLSIHDYLYTGSNKGFINNEKYSYLANHNEDNEVWYITNDGKLDVTSGEDILGIKATVTLAPNLELKGGTGKADDPYQFEEATGLIGSYVKLGNDTWRIYEEKDGIIKLILQDTINDGDGKLKHIYSKSGYYHNDTIRGSLAYYLNRTYYNSLSYRDLIVESTYINGFYGSDTDYQYDSINDKTIETMIAVPSIHNVIWNDTLDGYFTDTGISQNSSVIYIRKSNGFVTNKSVTSEAYVIPCISINKDNLTVGSGNTDDPYRTE